MRGGVGGNEIGGSWLRLESRSTLGQFRTLIFSPEAAGSQECFLGPEFVLVG